MKKIVYISLATIMAMTLSTASPAFSKERVIIKKGDDPAKVKVVEKKSPYIGIYMDDLNEKLMKDLDYPKDSGVWIMSVIDDSPAQRAGLEDDDIIYMIDGERIGQSTDIGEILKKREAGETIVMVVYRDGVKKELNVELGESMKQYYTIDINNDKSSGREIAMPSWSVGAGNYRDAIELFREMSGGGLVIGVRIHDMDPDLAAYFSVDKGVLVLDVLDGTAAEKAGIRSGDIIAEVAGGKIVDAEGLQEALRDADRDAETLDIVVIRKGERKTFTFDCDDLADQSTRLWIAPEEGDFKHFKLNVPEQKLQLEDLKEHDRELLDREIELDRLKAEIETLEKRLRKLEKDKD